MKGKHSRYDWHSDDVYFPTRKSSKQKVKCRC